MPERGQYTEFLLKSSPSPVIMHTDMAICAGQGRLYQNAGRPVAGHSLILKKNGVS